MQLVQKDQQAGKHLLQKLVGSNVLVLFEFFCAQKVALVVACLRLHPLDIKHFENKASVGKPVLSGKLSE
jgi:hypothetical protein